MSDIRFEGWLHRSGTGGVYQDSAGNVGIASTQPQTRLDIGNGGFQVGPTGIATVTTVNTTNLINATPLSHRNIIINGDMSIAQRGSSSTTADTYHTVDRMMTSVNGLDENCTFSQHDLSSSAPPYAFGLRKAFRIQNGNQSSGAGAADYIQFQYRIEAQDMALSGWNYTSSSSYITLQFWIKSSVAQNFYGYLRTKDGTGQLYPFETGSLTADTWTKIEKTIPGNSNITIDNNTGEGFQINLSPFWGTNYTGSVSLNAWGAFSGSARTPDHTSTWYTTNDALFQITGIQLEVGSVATPFEHRGHADELRRCRRYYQVGSSIGAGYGSANGYARAGSVYGTQMRATPTFTPTNTGSGSIIASATSNTGFYVTYGSLGGSSAGIFSFTADAEL